MIGIVIAVIILVYVVAVIWWWNMPPDLTGVWAVPDANRGLGIATISKVDSHHFVLTFSSKKQAYALQLTSRTGGVVTNASAVIGSFDVSHSGGVQNLTLNITTADINAPLLLTKR